MAGNDLKRLGSPLKPIDLRKDDGLPPAPAPLPEPKIPWKDSDRRMFHGLNLLQSMAQGILDVPQDALDAYQAWTKFGTVEKANEYLDGQAAALKGAILRTRSPDQVDAMTQRDHSQMFWDMRPNSLAGDKEFYDEAKRFRAQGFGGGLPTSEPPILRNKRYQFLPEKLSRKLEYDTPWFGSPLGENYGPPGLF